MKHSIPAHRLAIYCCASDHAASGFPPFLVGESYWEAHQTVEDADGVFGIAVMELNRSRDEILTAAMERGADTYGAWTIANDVPAPHRLGVSHRPRFKNAEMVTLHDESPRGRVSIRLRCALCGLSYKRRMPEFCERLDALAENGITGISLGSLIDTTK